MSKKNILFWNSVKYPFVVFMALIGVAAISHSARAACLGVPATAQVTQLNWPGMQIPAGSTTYIVSGTGAVDSGTGTKLYGTSARGRYTISKASGSEAQCATITIDVQSANCNATGCSLGSWTGTYNGTTLSGSPPWTGLAKPAAGKTLYLGATATYGSTVTAGTKTPSFTLAIHYDSRSDTTFAKTGNANFDAAVTIDTVTNIGFGTVKAVTAGNYTINTAGVVTAAGGGVLISGTTAAGSMKIHGSANQTINVSTGSFVAGGTGSGVTLSNPTCSYGGGAEGSCTINGAAAPTAAGTTLLIGVKATVDANQSAGTTATPSLTVTVVYS